MTIKINKNSWVPNFTSFTKFHPHKKFPQQYSLLSPDSMMCVQLHIRSLGWEGVENFRSLDLYLSKKFLFCYSTHTFPSSSVSLYFILHPPTCIILGSKSCFNLWSISFVISVYLSFKMSLQIMSSNFIYITHIALSTFVVLCVLYLHSILTSITSHMYTIFLLRTKKPSTLFSQPRTCCMIPK